MTDGPGLNPWCAIVVNPAKAGDRLVEVEQLVAAVTERSGWDPPKLWETTIEDPGVGQAREAVAAGAALVIAAGGDGTVRSVAGVLAGTGIPMGLLPMGTGNLLARNIGIPLNDTEAAVEIIMNGDTAQIDVARVRALRASGAVEEQTSVVMLGIGFDAELIAGTDETLKRRVGWVAYVAAGLPLLAGPRIGVRLSLDDQRPVTRRVRTVLVATCGLLTGGVLLLPQARYDDGLADVLTVSPKGVAGWASIIAWALSKDQREPRLISHGTARRVRLDTREGVAAQVDGDAIGDVVQLDVTTEHGALTMRVPVADSSSS